MFDRTKTREKGHQLTIKMANLQLLPHTPDTRQRPNQSDTQINAQRLWQHEQGLHRYKSDEVPVLRRGNRHKFLFTTNNMSSIANCQLLAKEKKIVSPKESCTLWKPVSVFVLFVFKGIKPGNKDSPYSQQ